MVNAIKGTAHPQGGSTIAEGIAVGQPGQITREIVRELVDDLVLVDEGDIEQAVLMLLEIEKTVVEGAGAAGLAALLEGPGALSPAAGSAWCCAAATSTRCCWRRSSSAAWCAPGGWRASASPRATRRACWRASPRVVAEAGANIDEVHHQRAFSTLSAQNVDVELVLQTRNPAHVREVVAALLAAGFDAATY